MLPTSHSCWESALVFAESPFDCLNVQFWLGFLVWITWFQILRWLKTTVFVCSIFTFQVRTDFFLAQLSGFCLIPVLAMRPTPWSLWFPGKDPNFWRTGSIDGLLPDEGAWLVKVPIMVDVRKFQKHPHGQPSFGAKHPFLGVKNRQMLDNPKKGKVNHN